MDWKIIADSCCDMTPELRERLGVITIPLTIRIGNKEHVDDENLDIDAFISEMSACTEKSGTAAPSPLLYQEAIETAINSFVVTLSSKLSGSYASAVLGMKNAEKRSSKVLSHVFDSKSACAAEVLIAVKIRELLQGGMAREHIVSTMNSFIENMKTYFVLDRYDNLLKAGRLNKIAGKLISVLNIKLLMGANKEGEIALYGNVRNASKIIDKMIGLITESGKKTEGESMVIAHVNNPGLAEKLRAAVESRFSFKEVLVLQTRGISSYYADVKGIVMAF